MANYGYFSCATMEIIERAGIVVAQLFCAVIMAIRVYVLYKRSRIILVSLSIVAVGILCFSFWAFFFSPFRAKEMKYICYVDTASALHIAILWSGQLLFDAIMFVLTLWKSYCLGKVGDRSLVDILLRDGAIYFAIISGVNAANIAILLVRCHIVNAYERQSKALAASVSYRQLQEETSGSTYVPLHRVNVIMVSRLVLNLQESDRRGSAENTEHSLMPMTTVVPLDDVLLTMHADDS
ncbi:hypothetical protein JVT61DRAFT_10447 [Boletus reticuloceps]|uniref:Uncharacterized protein n=1 Tax=Boletus reticuloceps TaxID=495285 RepID=A0A8I2YWF7_9AGAM|nr:hypothetical protein JVT61DRAFT_10447 [Boletus reticuloceps]